MKMQPKVAEMKSRVGCRNRTIIVTLSTSQGGNDYEY